MSDRIVKESKLVRVGTYALVYAEFNKRENYKSVGLFIEEAIIEKWKRENPDSGLVVEGGKVNRVNFKRDVGK